MTALSAERLLDDARAATALSDFGGDTFLPGLEVLVDALEREARLSAVGRVAMPLQLGQLLANRLEVQDWVTRHPEIVGQPVAPPLFVVGLPRTGTTLLSFLLARNEANRSLRYWEARRPCPPPDAAAIADDPRRLEASESLAALDAIIPEFKAIHPQEPDGPTECVTLLAHEFQSVHFETLASVPSYGEWHLTQDLGPAYRYHRRLLQVLQWRCPAPRWVLKSPAHLLGLDEIVALHPGARFVWTHRDPATVVASTCSLVGVLRRVASDDVRAEDAAAQWPARLAAMVDRALAFRDRADDDAFLDLDYRALVADPVGAVRRIYQFAGWQLAPATEDRMRTWIAANPQDRHGRHRYSLGDFGLDPVGERERFAAYVERYGVEPEGGT